MRHLAVLSARSLTVNSARSGTSVLCLQPRAVAPSGQSQRSHSSRCQRAFRLHLPTARSAQSEGVYSARCQRTVEQQPGVVLRSGQRVHSAGSQAVARSKPIAVLPVQRQRVLAAQGGAAVSAGDGAHPGGRQ